MDAKWTKRPYAGAAHANAAFLRKCNRVRFAAQRISPEQASRNVKSGNRKLPFRYAIAQQSGRGTMPPTSSEAIADPAFPCIRVTFPAALQPISSSRLFTGMVFACTETALSPQRDQT